MSEVTLGGAYQVVLAQLAREVLTHGVAPVAEQIRAKGDLSQHVPPFDRLAAPAKQTGSLLAQANLLGAVRRYFAEKTQRREVAQGLLDVANGQRSLDDGTLDVVANVKLLNKGLAALKGTELEGLIPQSYVDQLRERYRSSAAQSASQVVARLVGEGTTGLLLDGNQNFLTALKGVVDEKGGPTGPAAELAANLQAACAALSTAFKADGAIELTAVEAALHRGWAVFDSPGQKALLSGLQTSMLSAFCRCLVRVADFAAAYPGEPLVAPDLKGAQRAILWNSQVGGASLGEMML